MTPPTYPTAPGSQPAKATTKPAKRPSVVALLSDAKVSSATRELDISFAYDITPKVVETLCACMPQLRKLIIREVGLKELPEAVGQLKHLKELDLSHNALTALPKSIGKLRELQHLNISRNNVAVLPVTLSGMKNLRLFNANYNALATLPEALGSLPALRVLRLGANQLQGLPQELAALGDLRLVQLAYNNIEQVPQVLWQLPELKVVDLAHNLISQWPARLVLPSNLSNLNITGNPMGEPPKSLVLAQSHELKIIGLPKAGGTRVTQVGEVGVHRRPPPQPEHKGDDNRLALNATQDLTGILFAGLGDFAVPGEPTTSPESKQDHELDTEPNASRPKRH